MPKELSKFAGPNVDSHEEFVHPNVFQREVFPTWSRITFGAERWEVPVMLELSCGMKGPFVVVYVLLVPREGHRAGRYESPQLSYDELELFLSTYQEFFEQDGRHHVWVISASGEGQLIFDHHNVVYAYGDLDAYETTLRRRGSRTGTGDSPIRG